MNEAELRLHHESITSRESMQSCTITDWFRAELLLARQSKDMRRMAEDLLKQFGVPIPEVRDVET